MTLDDRFDATAPATAPATAGRSRRLAHGRRTAHSSRTAADRSGDIQGALGTIRLHDTARPATWRRRLLTLAAIIGPGVIVMTGDNDAGGVQTYTQAGQQFGNSLMWVLIPLFVVLFVSQEMVTRLGAVTATGHASLIRARFGRFWSWFSVGDLFVLNMLTLLTEFIGVYFAMAYFGVPKWVSVPAAAVVLVAFAATGSFRRWERAMLLLVVCSLVFIPCLLLAHPTAGPVLRGLIPGVQGGMSGAAILVIVALVGTTVAPWQLFFQQSSIIDKRISPRWLRYERADTLIGCVLTTVAAGGMIAFAAFASNGTARFGASAVYTDSGWFDEAIRATLGPMAGALSAVMLLVAALLGAGAVTLSTSYALGDALNRQHSLHGSPRSAPAFFSVYTGQVVLAAAVVLVGGNVFLGSMTQYVQVLAGVLLPSAVVFLALLCNDRDVLGPWVNRTWQNVVTFAIVGVLVVLSLILVVSTLFPAVPGVALTAVLFGAAGAVSAVVLPVWIVRARRHRVAAAVVTPSGDRVADRETWRMPPLASLPDPVMSAGRRLGLWMLRVYLVVAGVLVAIKVFAGMLPMH